MKVALILVSMIMGSASFAAEAPVAKTETSRHEMPDFGNVDKDTKWRLGVGFAMQAQMQSGSDIEIGTGELFHCRNHGFSLILGYGGRDTIAEDPNNEHYTNHNYRLMLESKLHGSNEFNTAYIRLGVGYTDTDDIFHPDGGFIMMPFQIGMDTQIMKTDWSKLAFFVQAGADVNFLGDNTPAKNFDGLGMTVGFRGYY